MQRALPLLSVFIILFFAACEDPSNVGLGLIDDPIAPHVEALSLTDFSPSLLPDRTGNTDRVLAGTVNDPVLGIIEATGYLNVARGDNAPDLSAPVDSVILTLTRDYVYGDTTQSLDLVLRDVAADERWSSSGAPADTSLPAGDNIQTFTIAPEDTTTRITLPPEWIEENEETLVSGDFNDLFTGFMIEAASGSDQLIRGFAVQDITFTVYADGESAVAGISNLITGLQRTSPPDLQADAVLFQDGVPPDPDAAIPTGSGWQLGFDVSEFENQSLNGARLELHLDRDVLEENTPEHFYRPEAEEIRLIGVDEDGDVVFVGNEPLVSVAPTFDEDRLLFETADQQSFGLTDYLQDFILGPSEAFEEVDRIELRLPTNINSLNALVLKDQTHTETAPTLRLTLSGD